MSNYHKVLSRVSELLKTENPDKELNLLATYQMETSPEMNKQQALNCVILGLIRTYQDYTLDYLWLQYIKEAGHDSDSEAA